MVIDLFHRCSPDEQAWVRDILNRDRSETRIDEVERTISLMNRYGSIERAEDACREWAAAAEAHLNEIPPSEARETMREMCSFLVDRAF